MTCRPHVHEEGGGFEPTVAPHGQAVGCMDACCAPRANLPPGNVGFHTSLSPLTVCAGQPLIVAHQQWLVLCRAQECGDLEMAGEFYVFFFFCLISELCGCSSYTNSVMGFGNKLRLENKSDWARGPCMLAAEGDSPLLHKG